MIWDLVTLYLTSEIGGGGGVGGVGWYLRGGKGGGGGGGRLHGVYSPKHCDSTRVIPFYPLSVEHKTPNIPSNSILLTSAIALTATDICQ